MTRWVILLAGLLGAVGVTIGAYAAHGLEESLLKQGLEAADVSKRLEQCEVAVRYHMTHVLALLALGIPAPPIAATRRALACCFFLLGIMLFSGGLYSMVFLGEMGHWAIVPSGGLCFILGWLAVACMALGQTSTDKCE